jgi:hypothetical protein
MGNYFSTLIVKNSLNNEVFDKFNKYNKFNEYKNEPLKYNIDINKSYRPNLSTIYE